MKTTSPGELTALVASDKYPPENSGSDTTECSLQELRDQISFPFPSSVKKTLLHFRRGKPKQKSEDFLLDMCGMDNELLRDRVVGHMLILLSSRSSTNTQPRGLFRPQPDMMTQRSQW